METCGGRQTAVASCYRPQWLMSNAAANCRAVKEDVDSGERRDHPDRPDSAEHRQIDISFDESRPVEFGQSADAVPLAQRTSTSRALFFETNYTFVASIRQRKLTKQIEKKWESSREIMNAKFSPTQSLQAQYNDDVNRKAVIR